MHDNVAALERVKFDPRWLIDVSSRDAGTTVFGNRLEMPVMLAPTGLTRLSHPKAELAGCRAAGKAGTVFIVSTTSTYPIEAITRVAGGPVWFQLYLWRDPDDVAALVDRVGNAGCEALVLTIDVPLAGNRERDARNGATLPPRLGPRQVFGAVRHPRWTVDFFRPPRVWYGSLPNGVRPDVGIGDTSATWERLRWLRGIWPKTLIVKGVLSVRDALQAVAAGADGVYVSNHGGRQLDGCRPTAEVLPKIAAAVGDKSVVLVDGGIRRGSDAVKVRALGASASLIGRPWVFALAAGGESAVVELLQAMKEDVDRTLALVGVPRYDDVDHMALAGDMLADSVS